MFRSSRKKRIMRAQAQIQSARINDRDPADLRFPIKSTDKTKPVDKFFNSFRLNNRHRFTLRAFGRPFNFHGVMTKRYDMPAMQRLFYVDNVTIRSWVRNEYLPVPFIRVVGKKSKVYWFYHQVQPFYVWYWNRKARGIGSIHATASDLKLLKRLLKMQERRWYHRLEIPYLDPYIQAAGKYGVIYPVEN